MSEAYLLDMDLPPEELAKLIAAAQQRRALLRDLEPWVAARRAAGERHDEIVAALNAAGWAAKFGKPLDISMYHQERSVLARQARGGRKLVVRKTTADKIAEAVVERLRVLGTDLAPAVLREAVEAAVVPPPAAAPVLPASATPPAQPAPAHAPAQAVPPPRREPLIMKPGSVPAEPDLDPLAANPDARAKRDGDVVKGVLDRINQKPKE